MNKSRILYTGTVCSTIVGECIEDFVGKPKGQRLLGRPIRRWENNIKIYLGEIGFGVMYCIKLA
jgi:hypothetical protein